MDPATVIPKQEVWPQQELPSERTSARSGVTVCKRIVVGTYSFPLGINVRELLTKEKRKYGTMTHKWICLLRSPDNENMSHYIRKVQFDLDPSFINPRRVSEVGWGEFYITVSIYFADESLDSVKVVHLLKLNPPDSVPSKPTCVTNETHDEIVFVDPSEHFYQKLQNSTYDIIEPSIYQPYFWDYEKKARDEMYRYIYCQSYLQSETLRLMAEANTLSSQIIAIQNRINSLYQPKQEEMVPIKKEQQPAPTTQQSPTLGSPPNSQETPEVTTAKPTPNNNAAESPTANDKQ